MAARSAGDAPASSAAQIEAEIRKRSRPMLSEAERRRLGLEHAVQDAQLAAARARDAAAAQTERAAQYDAQVQELQGQLAALPPPGSNGNGAPNGSGNGGSQ